MGYSIYLVDEKRSITQGDVQKIFEALPTEYRGATYSRQGWGWSTVSDISMGWNNRNHEYLRISGSYAASGTWAALVTIHWQQELYKLGYANIVVISEDFAFNSKVGLNSFPRIKCILPEQFQIILSRVVPEDQMGCQVVDIILKTGTVLNGIHVYNCSEFWHSTEIKGDDISNITLA